MKNINLSKVFNTALLKKQGFLMTLFIMLTFNSFGIDKAHSSSVQPINTTMVSNQILTTVVDDDFSIFNNNPNWNLLFTNLKVENKIVLQINRDFHLTYLKDTMLFQIILETNFWDISSGNLTPSAFPRKDTVFLRIDTAAMAKEKDKVVLIYPNHVKSEVRVVSVTILNQPLMDYFTDPNMPQITIENTLDIKRIYQMDMNPVNTQVGTPSGLPGKKHELKFSWLAKAGAEKYEVEYMFIDNPLNRNPNVGTPFSPTYIFNFKNNATRVEVISKTSLTIPNIWPQGRIVFRVRAIGYDLNFMNYSIASLWSLPDKFTYANLNTLNNPSPVRGVHNYSYESNTGKENGNWSFQSSFSEDGNIHSSITWMDGTLRPRQQIVKSNETGLFSISQTIYDYLGREALKAMPAVSKNKFNGFEYQWKFNQNRHGNQYSWKDFELDNGGPTPIIEVDTMKSESGASLYHSPNFSNSSLNPIYNSLSSSQKRMHLFVPQAKGYNFTQTEFTDDPSGRVLRSGSIGKAMQLKANFKGTNNLLDGHETRIWDGTPSQEELDVLFAMNVGDAKKYKKVMTKDPNGQLSIAYLDPYGRTIATALAGKPSNTPSLIPLNSADQSLTYKVGIKNNPQGNNDMVREVNTSFLISSDQDWKFYYSLNKEQVNIACDSNVCYDCAYELTLSLKNKAGKEMIPISQRNQFIGVIDSINLSCDTTTFFSINPNPLTLFLKVGEYQLVKTLTLSRQGMDFYRDLYLKDTLCIKSLDDFILEELDILDIECNYDCSDCDSSLKGLNNAIDTISLYLTTHSTDTLAQKKLKRIKDEKDELSKICDQICARISTCDIFMKIMIDDVSLGGQYLKYEERDDNFVVIKTYSQIAGNLFRDNLYDCTDSNGNTASKNWRTPYNPEDSTHYYKNTKGDIYLIPVHDNIPEKQASSNYDIIDGQKYIRPQYLLFVSDFKDYWKPQWAKSLVYLHPEYCYYGTCKSLESSFEYDKKMIEEPSAKQARIKGYYNPLGQSNLGTDNDGNNINYSSYEGSSPSRDPIINNPFYTKTKVYYGGAWTGPAGLFLKDEMLKKKNITCYPDTLKTIWEIFQNKRLEFELSGLVDTCMDDVFWPLLRAMYLEQKYQWYESYFDDSCKNNGKCIGSVNPSRIKIARWIYPNTIPQTFASTELDSLSDHDTWNAVRIKCHNLSNPDAMNAAINKDVSLRCEKTCAANAEMWYQRLLECDKVVGIIGQYTTKKAAIIDSFKSLCKSGCDFDNPYGSVSPSPTSKILLKSIGEVLDFHLGSSWFNAGICDDLLIDFPGQYGHDYVATDNPDADSCACDSVKWKDTYCPDLTDTAYMVQDCGCNQTNPELKEAKLALLDLEKEHKCQNCITCQDLQSPVSEFITRYPTINILSDSSMYQQLLETHLNRHFGFNLFYDNYKNYAEVCLDSIVVGDWTELWKLVGTVRLISQIDHKPKSGNNSPFITPYKLLPPTDNIGLGKELNLKSNTSPKNLKGWESLHRWSQNQGENLWTSTDVALPNDPSSFAVPPPYSAFTIKLACNCAKILTVNKMVEDGINGGLTGSALYNQKYNEPFWPYAPFSYDFMKKACCRLWNKAPYMPPPDDACTPQNFKFGDVFNNDQKGFIESESTVPVALGTDIAELLDAPQPPCAPEPQQNNELEYIDTCGCNKLKGMNKDYLLALANNTIPPNMTFEAYILQQKGMTITKPHTATDILNECEKQWGTGELKDDGGNVIATYTKNSGWEKISTQNLKKHALNLNLLIPKGLGCNPPPPCFDKISCSVINTLFKDYLMRKANEDKGAGLKGSDALKLPDHSKKPTEYINEITDWMLVNNQILAGGLSPTGHLLERMMFLDSLLIKLNNRFTKCDSTKPKSLAFFIKKLHACTPVCAFKLDCDSLGADIKHFLDSVPYPSGYTDPNHTSMKNYTFDMKWLFYETRRSEGGQAFKDWFAALEKFLNKKHKNGCTGKDYPLFWMFSHAHCPGSPNPDWPRTPYKPEKCKKCYVANANWMQLFQTFLNDVTLKDDPDQLFQSLWKVKPSLNPPKQFPSFYNTPLYSINGMQGVYSNDLRWELYNVETPLLDVSIKDYNGFVLNFSLQMGYNAEYLNYAYIKSFSNIESTNLARCAKPRYFKMDALYKVPKKYWVELDNQCNYLFDPYTLDTLECNLTIPITGEVKDGTTQSALEKEVPCLGCAKLCNRPYVPTVFKGEKCQKSDISIAIHNGLNRYGRYIEQKKEEFDSAYKAKCMASKETIQAEFKNQQSHYTLYYYDQAGNLVKTIPPEGVDISNTSLSQADRQFMANSRIEQCSLKRLDPINAANVFTAHSLASQYKFNSLNQPTWQKTPDGGESQFWYDGLGRLILSQNAKQKDNFLYSYTEYDALGRIKEVGEIHPPNVVSHSDINPQTLADPVAFSYYMDIGTNYAAKKQVTRSYYDVNPTLSNTRIDNAFTAVGGQQNLRSRVAATTFEKVNDNEDSTYNHASFFTYDIHGNVNRYVQEIPELTFMGKNIYTIDYDFDLLTNKVLEVSYQKDKPDQYFHRYDYDKDQRLTTVQTSTDHVIWEQDAKYYYYLHGPLGRTELGELQVQGIDYAYTLNGSLKAVNGAFMSPQKDMGQDGLISPSQPSGNNEWVARDAFAFNLSYYRNDGMYSTFEDYVALNGDRLQPKITPFSDLNMHFASLFNGNIAQMNTSLPTAAGIGQQKLLDSTLGNVYRYDQLNRLRNHFSFTNLDKINNEWISSNNIFPPQMPQMGMDQNYEAFNYDANGNILTLQRHGHKANMLMQMDDLSYKFQKKTIGLKYTYKGNTQTLIWDRLVHNKLKYVTDQVAAANYTNDVETQNTLNYAYDKLGNLIKDNAEDIATIKWNVSGKIEEIIRTTNSTKPDLEFGYNTQGTRMYKIVKPKNSGGGLMYQHAWKITYYVRDLQGSVMATYSQKYTEMGSSSSLKAQMVLNDHHIYGSSRVGVQHSNAVQTTRNLSVTYFTSTGKFANINYTNTVTNIANINLTRAILIRGYKTYELTNHLGNVLATIQDRKLNKNDNTGPVFTTQYYIPFVNSVTDYFAFGSEMGGRSFVTLSGDEEYRYGFQNQEKDDEIKGKGNSVNYKYRMHDPRLGRFFAVDPLAGKYPQWSSYQFSGNQVISTIELEGAEPEVNLNMSLNFTFGNKEMSFGSMGLSGSVMQNIKVGQFASQFALNYSFNISNGGLTSQNNLRTSLNKTNYEIIFSPSMAIGGVSTSSISTNYLHGNASTSLLNPIKYSVLYALNFHYTNREENQRTATYGMRIGEFSLNILEDHSAWVGADKFDRWWTGSGNINWHFKNKARGILTFGTDTRTGNSDNSTLEREALGDTRVGGKVLIGPNKGKDFYWANQNQYDRIMGKPLGYNKSLNNAQTYIQYKNSKLNLRIVNYGPSNFWSQNVIHDFLTPNFHHFEPSLTHNTWMYFIGIGN